MKPELPLRFVIVLMVFFFAMIAFHHYWAALFLYLTAMFEMTWYKLDDIRYHQEWRD